MMCIIWVCDSCCNVVSSRECDELILEYFDWIFIIYFVIVKSEIAHTYTVHVRIKMIV